MSDDPKVAGTDGGPDIDPGERVAILAGFEQDISPAFLGRVRRKIYRRSTVSHLASFSWSIPRMLLVEFWTGLIQFLGPRNSTPKGGPS